MIFYPFLNGRDYPGKVAPRFAHGTTGILLLWYDQEVEDRIRHAGMFLTARIYSRSRAGRIRPRALYRCLMP